MNPQPQSLFQALKKQPRCAFSCLISVLTSALAQKIQVVEWSLSLPWNSSTVAHHCPTVSQHQTKYLGTSSVPLQVQLKVHDCIALLSNAVKSFAFTLNSISQKMLPFCNGMTRNVVEADHFKVEVSTFSCQYKQIAGFQPIICFITVFISGIYRH